MVYFSTTILKNVGLSPFYQQLLAAVMNTAFWLGTIPLYWTIERWGRRPILFWSAIACTAAMAVFVAMNGVQNKTPATQWTAVVFVIIFVFIFGFGWIAIPWLYPSEIGKSPISKAIRETGETYADWFHLRTSSSVKI